VDIGCGMRAVKLDVGEEVLTKDILESIVIEVKRTIPMGFAKQPIARDWGSAGSNLPVIKDEYENSMHQLGTLGGGNHFIEVQKDEENYIWLMIHSGSRNLGKKVCDYFNKKAKILNEKYFSSVPSDLNLAFLPIDTQEGRDYYNAMKLCMKFAHMNREFMMDTLFEIFRSKIHSNVDVVQTIDVHHNYCALEHHFGENVYVHRKGAIRVRKDEIGIIPGSMGTPSYIVKGLGNPNSFCSASHGAGRVMSRTAINNKITEEEANESIKGIVFSGWGKDRKDRKGRIDISECPLAYKNIEEVINNEIDLITPIVKLTPLASIKG
jgi:tRNA-splicing ligase RtcB